MSHTSSESDSSSSLKDQAESPFIYESNCEGSLSGGDGSLKKGPWTSAEDAILVDYVKKHGEGNWNAVRKHSGLLRCGKSCRLRWINHLRPDLKKGAFTPDEEQLIIQLHAKMGNKWAKMAAHLPGRTDNEIKNYWNTRIKRRQRAGLPLYPTITCSQLLKNQSQVGSEHGGCDKLKNSLQPSSYDIADVNQWTLLHNQQFPDISVSNMLDQGLGSQNYGSMFPTVNCKSLFPCFNENSTCELPATEQFSSSEKIHWPYGLDFPYDPDPDPGSENLAPLAGVVSGSHALPNGNFSTSQTLSVAVMLELPSLQYPETDLCSWLMSPPTPPIEAMDALIESPSAVSVQSNSVSHQNSGLLEELLHEAQAMASVESKPSERSLNSSVVMPSDTVETSPLSLCNTDWSSCSDPVSPLGCSANSVLSEYGPPIGISSLNESSSGHASSNLNVKLKNVNDVACQSDEQMETSQLDFSHHNVLLGPDRGHNVSRVRDIMNDAVATLLDDLCSERTCAVTTPRVSGRPSPLSQRLGLGMPME